MQSEQTERTEADLKSLGLPKWPKHVVTGKPVTVEQAKEIIRRTDSFFTNGYGGNNRDFERWARKLLGMPFDQFDRPRTTLKADASEAEQAAERDRWRALTAEWRAQSDEFDARWQPVRTEYVRNTWAASSFIFGPFGWCHPDGQIGYIDNVGKWPSIEDVLADWTLLAATFPFLDVGATLYSGESCEDPITPVVSFIVRDGTARVVDPLTHNVHAGHPPATRRADSSEDGTAAIVNAIAQDFFRNEQGLPMSWFEEWAVKFGKKTEAR